MNTSTPHDAAIIKLRESDKCSFRVIGRHLGISPHTVRDQYRRLTRRTSLRPPPKPRPCMCCAKSFMSSGPGHRLCGPCRDRAADMSPIELGYPPLGVCAPE